MSHEVHLTCQAEFSASHSLRVPEWSDEKNFAVFGKSANRHGHGHNYKVEVTVAGPVDPATGMVTNIQTLKGLLREVLQDVDHKNLNLDIHYFTAVLPTTENLAQFLWNKLKEKIPQPLKRIRLYEEEGLWVDFTGTVQLGRTYHFSSAHRLDSPELSKKENVELYGKCNNPNGHGHNYVLQLILEGKPDSITGQLTGLESLDQFIREKILDPWDHHYLNEDVSDFQGVITSGENILKVVWNKIHDRIPTGKLVGLKLGETSHAFFEYFGN